MAFINKAGAYAALAAVLLIGGRTQAVVLCGDCNLDGKVTAAEAATCLQIVLGSVLLNACQTCDCNGDSTVSGTEVQIAENNATPGCCVNNAVCQCGMPTGTPGETPTSTPTVANMPTNTATPTSTPTLPHATITPGGAPTKTASGVLCVGDCDNSHTVLVNELVTCVNVALETEALTVCPPCSLNGTTVQINDLITAVNNALDSCPGG